MAKDDRHVEKVFVAGNTTHVTLTNLDGKRDYSLWVDVSTLQGFNESSKPWILTIPANDSKNYYVVETL